MNYEPHTHEPNLQPDYDYSSITVDMMGLRHGEATYEGWLLVYGDTRVKIHGKAQPTAEQRRTALLAVIQEHDEGSKHENDLFAAVSKLKGKKVWASDVLAAPPRKHWWQKAAV